MYYDKPHGVFPPQESIASVKHPSDEARLIAEDVSIELQHYKSGSSTLLSRSDSQRRSMSTLQPNGPLTPGGGGGYIEGRAQCSR
jgi:hypothetical protein